MVQAVLELAKHGTDEPATLEYMQTSSGADGGVVWLGSGGCWEG